MKCCGRDMKRVCDICGSKLINKKKVKICEECRREVDTLFGVFVPHLCKECYGKVATAQRKNGQVCRLCHQPYINCCC